MQYIPEVSNPKSLASLTTQYDLDFASGDYGQTADLKIRTLRSLREFFGSRKHTPSDQMWTALSEVVQVIQDMADGTSRSSFFLSSLDPGVGKTQTLIRSIQALVNDPSYSDVGVVIFLARLEQIESVAAAMRLKKEQFAVLTSNGKANKLGSDDVNTAQVLFTTQQRLERVAGPTKPFASCRFFYFKGAPRQVRVWDETLCPGRAVTVDRDGISHLLQDIRPSFPGLARDLDVIVSELQVLPDKSCYQLADFVSRNLINVDQVRSYLTDRDEMVAEALWTLSGRTVRVRQSGSRQTILDYEEILPDDLAPMLILDASGRVRSTYQFWEERRGGLVRLTEAPKRYDNLTVRLVKEGGAKTSWRKSPAKLLEVITDIVNTKPEEDWLIVHHRPDSVDDFDLPAQLKQAFKGNAERLKCITWGHHCATNAYANIQNVVLAGTLFYNPATIEAIGRAAAKRPSKNAEFAKSDCSVVQLGEHKHNILQALCRGSVRECWGDGCRPCDAYIIASERSGIPKMISEVFPGAKVLVMEMRKTELRRRELQALELIVRALKGNPGGLLTFKDVMEALGIEDRANFKRIRKSPAFIHALARAGYQEVAGKRGQSGFVGIRCQ